MGQFSWLDCVDEKQIVDDLYKKVYVLVPKEFGGGHIEEECYDGYGDFGGHDIHDLVVDWNKDFIPEIIRKAEEGNWKCEFNLAGKEDLLQFYHTGKVRDGEKRNIGIIMACYDEDNSRLPYPIKITYHPDAVYEEYGPSKGDPNQGWPDLDDYEDFI